jgi:hypothetical protein
MGEPKEEHPPITLKKAAKHFVTITTHRELVREGCFAVGLYYQGLTHDLSKYSPTEFLVGARYYQGTRSPNNAEREDIGYSTSWLHHKGRNRHHYEYWLDYTTRPEDGGDHIGVIPCKMPGRYVVEMFMDRIAASKVYHKGTYTQADPWNYYVQGHTWNALHPETRKLLEKLLLMLRDEGEEKTFAYIRAHLYQKKDPVEKLISKIKKS